MAKLYTHKRQISLYLFCGTRWWHLQSRLGTADYVLVNSSLHYNDSLVTWTVIHMTAAKFNLLIFSVLGFALSNVTNIFIFLILDGFCLLTAWFCYAIISVRHLGSLVHIANRRSRSHITTDGQFVLASSSFWSRWPDVTFIWVTIYLFFMQGALSDERTGL
jgi:hypothetical protein